MNDREKVMSWLEGLAQPDWHKFHSDTEVQVIAESALAMLNDCDTQLQYRDDHIAMYQAEIKRLEALLKEQKTANLYKCPNCGTWVSAENVVRCKDCKYWYFADNRIPCEQENVCGRNGIAVTPDWFCAAFKGNITNERKQT